MNNNKIANDNAVMRTEINRMRQALQIVQKWQLPTTGQFWENDKSRPMSYGACYGSNGERDFMKSIANEALNQNAQESEQQLYTKEEIKDLIHAELKEANFLGKDNERYYTIIGIVMAALERK